MFKNVWHKIWCKLTEAFQLYRTLNFYWVLNCCYSCCFIRDNVTGTVFTEVTLKLHCVEVVNITYNIQYLRVNSLVDIIFFITSKMSGFELMKRHMGEALLFCFNF